MLEITSTPCEIELKFTYATHAESIADPFPLNDVYHALWAEIHSETSSTPEFLEEWLRRVPNIECGCQDWLREYVVNNPPRFDDWPRWTWELHNAVNAKLSKQHFSWSDYQNK